MIRIAVSAEELEKRIAKESKTWLQKAKKKAEVINKAGRVGGSDGIWSEIKAVYMK
jgi:hypothetical protein